MLRFFALLGLSVVLPTTLFSDDSSPNVVFIITDDQGYGDLSCHGNPVLKTPHLDALARESIRLDDYHVAPTCSPTRTALLTGHWTNRTGVWHTILGRSMLRPEETTMETWFKEAGYGTAMIGKWHLGDNYPFRPEDRDFDEVFRHAAGGVGQTPDFWDNGYFDDTFIHNGKPAPSKGYCTDVYFKQSKAFIEQQVAQKKPFFLYLSTNAPHGPYHARADDAAPYLKKELDLNPQQAHFFGMIANIDDNVGKLRAWLDEKRIAENTIFIFTTDNGTAKGQSIFNAGMRAAKGSHYDGGHRVPFFLHWPAGGFDKEKRIDTLTAHVDIAPTLLDLCGIQQPRETKFDGTSLKGLLTNPTEASHSWPDRILVTDSQRVVDPIKWRRTAIMTEHWRLTSSFTKQGELEKELYAIDDDPAQEKNIIEQHPQVVARLSAFYDDWWEDVSQDFGTPARIVVGHEAESPSFLNAHDWIAPNMVPWNQGHIRDASQIAKAQGFWNLHIHASGTYEIELRRWPREADAAISASLPPGAPVEGSKAYRNRPGEAIPVTGASIAIQNQEISSKVTPEQKSVTFSLKLDKGPAELRAHFKTDKDSWGAYYAYVQKID